MNMPRPQPFKHLKKVSCANSLCLLVAFILASRGVKSPHGLTRESDTPFGSLKCASVLEVNLVSGWETVSALGRNFSKHGVRTLQKGGVGGDG